MRRVLSVVISVLLIVMSIGLAPASSHTHAVLDLADVPLPVQDQLEDGYQILAGGYLNPVETANHIAMARHLNVNETVRELERFSIERTYVLNTVLPFDRADQRSDLASVVQTTVYQVSHESAAPELVAFLAEYPNTMFAESQAPAVPGAHTVHLVEEAGDVHRSVIADGNVVIELATNFTQADSDVAHATLLEGTLQRLATVRARETQGVSSMALTLAPSSNLKDYWHWEQTGVHGIYRYRDAYLQPAIGEMIPEESVQVAPGATSIWLENALYTVGSGTGMVNVGLVSFSSENDAESFLNNLADGEPLQPMIDPYFDIADGEDWRAESDPLVFRVTGSYEGQPYSGYVEFRQEGAVVAMVGYRAVGAAMPGAGITSALMDHQVNCLRDHVACAPVDLAMLTGTPQATPISDNDALGSSEFGWALPQLGPEWQVTERFHESGYDRIGIRNGSSLFEFESVINHHGEPAQCVIDQMELLREFEEHADIRLWKDPSDAPVGGSSPEHAWVVYRVEPLQDERADQEYVIRIDCFRLDSSTANLVMTQTAPVDAWIDERAKGDDLREMLELPVTWHPRGTIMASAHDRRTAMILTHWFDQAA